MERKGKEREIEKELNEGSCCGFKIRTMHCGMAFLPSFIQSSFLTEIFVESWGFILVL